jgi:hypothetical protein
MTIFLKRQTYRTLLFLMFAALSMSHLYAQNTPKKRQIFIIPFENRRDTFDRIEDAGKKWFDLNKKTDKSDETQYKYVRAKPSPSGSSVIIIVQRTWTDRAGVGGALKPKKETDDPEEAWTNIDIDSAENRGLGRTLEIKNKSEADKFEGGAMGVAMSLDSNNKLVPILRYDNKNKRGRQFIKFDGVEGNTLIDRKLNVTTFNKSIDQVQRADEALKQNTAYSVRYEVPANRVAAMKKLLMKAGVANNPRITVAAVKP